MYEKLSVARTAYLSEILESSLQYYYETYETEPYCIFMHPDAYKELEVEWGREPVNFMGIKIQIVENLDKSSVFIV